MFRDWDGFYLIIGSAAGALIGLMFVVVTLTAAGLASSRRPSHGSDIYPTASKVYLTPIVFHFAIVMIISAISAVPDLPPRATDAALTLCAAIGLVYSVTTTIRTLRLGEGFPPPIGRTSGSTESYRRSPISCSSLVLPERLGSPRETRAMSSAQRHLAFC